MNNRPTGTPIQQWQYKQITLTASNDSLVAAAGKEGWEAFAVIPPQQTVWGGYPIMYFKRPIITTQYDAAPIAEVGEIAKEPS